MKKSIFTICCVLSFLVILLSFQITRKQSKDYKFNNLINRIDTLKSSGYMQIVRYERGVITNIRVEQIKLKGDGVYIMSQDLSFDKRGILDSLYMFTGRKSIEVQGGSQRFYQSNYVYFDTLGDVQDFLFMKDFRYEYKMK